MKPEFIRFEFPLVGEPTRDPEATWARAMDASRWSRARRVWGLPVIESDACPHEGAFLLDRAWLRKNFVIVDGEVWLKPNGFISAMLKPEGKDVATPEECAAHREYRRKHGKGPYNLLPGEELC